jgi:hypothetical protein
LNGKDFRIQPDDHGVRLEVGKKLSILQKTPYIVLEESPPLLCAEDPLLKPPSSKSFSLLSILHPKEVALLHIKVASHDITLPASGTPFPSQK